MHIDQYLYTTYIYLPIYLSIYLPTYLSMYLSIYLPSNLQCTSPNLSALKLLIVHGKTQRPMQNLSPRKPF